MPSAINRSCANLGYTAAALRATSELGALPSPTPTPSRHQDFLHPIDNADSRTARMRTSKAMTTNANVTTTARSNSTLAILIKIESSLFNSPSSVCSASDPQENELMRVVCRQTIPSAVSYTRRFLHTRRQRLTSFTYSALERGAYLAVY